MTQNYTRVNNEISSEESTQDAQREAQAKQEARNLLSSMLENPQDDLLWDAPNVEFEDCPEFPELDYQDEYTTTPETCSWNLAEMPVYQKQSTPNNKTGGLRWQLRTLKDAYAERPPVQYVVDNLLMLPSLNVMYGAPGCMKSMLLADMAACVASGQPWLSGLPTEEGAKVQAFRTMQSAVLWIDYDNGTMRTDERFEAVARARGLNEDAPIHYVSMAQPWLNATNNGMISELITLVTELSVKLVVIDNLGLISGDADENSADMVQVMGNLRRFSEASGAAVVVIHHQRKGALADRAGDLLRGHSSIEASLDLALLVTRENQDPEVIIRPTKVRGAAVAGAFSGEFSYSHKPGRKELEQARFWGVAVMTEKEAANAEIANAVLILLNRTTEAMNQGDLTKDVAAYLETNGIMKKPGRDHIRGVLNNMVNDGRIIADKGEKGALFYRTK